MTEKAIIYSRFSSDEQEKGDSLARQKRICEAYALECGWEVVDHLVDRGRSAYKGEHLAPEAELGAFTAQVHSGQIEDGTILVVEKLDRLSRRPIGEAMAWIYAITNQGIKIAVAGRKKVIDSGLDLGSFIECVVELAVGNEESAKKSIRVLSAKRSLWSMAEKRTGNWTNLSGRVPLWLSRNDTRNAFEVDDDRVQIIRDIYQWSADGLGSQAIARRLNETGVKPWGVWRKYEAKWGITSVNALLCNPAVEGDFVPKYGEFGGQVLRNYYPRVVDADLVARARAGKAERTKQAGTRARNGVSNLFARLTVCGECGGSAFLSSSFTKGRRYPYLRCEGAREGRGCKNSGYYAYAAFEETALDLLLDLALDDRFFEAKGELRNLRIRKAEVEKSICDQAQRQKALLNAFGADSDRIQVVVQQVREIQSELDRLSTSLEELTGEIERASGKVGAISKAMVLWCSIRLTDVTKRALISKS